MNPLIIIGALIVGLIIWITISDNFEDIGEKIIEFIEYLKNDD